MLCGNTQGQIQITSNIKWDLYPLIWLNIQTNPPDVININKTPTKHSVLYFQLDFT